MTNHLTGGPPAKLSRAFVYEFPNKFKPTNVLLKTTHGHAMRAWDDMQTRYSGGGEAHRSPMAT